MKNAEYYARARKGLPPTGNLTRAQQATLDKPVLLPTTFMAASSLVSSEDRIALMQIYQQPEVTRDLRAALERGDLAAVGVLLRGSAQHGWVDEGAVGRVLAAINDNLTITYLEAVKREFGES